jgi:predicted Mrr-cat superfamily restriction endonuclease
MNVWRLIPHHKDRDAALLWGRQHSRIAIGWGGIGDIGSKGYSSSQDINKEILKLWLKEDSTHGGPSLWRFYTWMQKGDLVILKSDRGFESVVEVKGDYEWNNAPLTLNDGTKLSGYHWDYWHQRRVAPTNRDPKKLWESVGGRAPGENHFFTLHLCGQNPL